MHPKGQRLITSSIESLGKLPPQAADLEETVLAAMLLEKHGVIAALNIINSPEVFYREAHQRIFTAIITLFRDGHPVDIATVTNELRRTGNLEFVGGAYYVSGLIEKANSAANIEYHASVLAEFAVKRDLISYASVIHRDAYEDTTDVFDLLDFTSLQLINISSAISKRKALTGKALYKEAMQQVTTAMLTPGATGLPDGITALDNVTGGDHKGDLIVIAARPGMGKTARLMHKVRHVTVVLGKKAMVFSLEMPAVQLMMRLIGRDAHYSVAKMKKGYVKDYELADIQTKSANLYNDNLIIDDTPGLSIFELRRKALAAKIADPELALIAVDYLQLMKGEGSGNREQEISSITRALKQLARELDIPIIALSQLSRSVESRSDKRPQLSDLRESGSIEQDADVVVFLLRPEYYKISEYANGKSTTDTMECIYAKNRHGPTTDVIIGCSMAHMDFFDLEIDNPFPKPNAPHPDKFTQAGSIDKFERIPEVKDEFNKGDDSKAPF